MSNSNREDALDFVDWDELKGKEARGVDKKVDLGEIQGIGRAYVVTKKGLVGKDKFYIPKTLAQKYDGKTVWFNVTEELKDEFIHENPPTDEEIAKFRTADSPTFVDDKVVVVSEEPLVEEKAVVVPTTVTATGSDRGSPIRDWDSIVHKTVRLMDGEPIGNVVALYPDTIHVETEGSRMAYDIPKSEIEGFNGAEIRLKAPITDLERYVKRE
ncbi:MAG TPA: hypothetical protein VHA09_01445 [Nitrososphaera sp.]|nr:hypothetical protein [Nitrososphaera sp.]